MKIILFYFTIFLPQLTLQFLHNMFGNCQIKIKNPLDHLNLFGCQNLKSNCDNCYTSHSFVFPQFTTTAPHPPVQYNYYPTYNAAYMPPNLDLIQPLNMETIPQQNTYFAPNNNYQSAIYVPNSITNQYSKPIQPNNEYALPNNEQLENGDFVINDKETIKPIQVEPSSVHSMSTIIYPEDSNLINTINYVNDEQFVELTTTMPIKAVPLHTRTTQQISSKAYSTDNQSKDINNSVYLSSQSKELLYNHNKSANISMNNSEQMNDALQKVSHFEDKNHLSYHKVTTPRSLTKAITLKLFGNKISKPAEETKNIEKTYDPIIETDFKQITDKINDRQVNVEAKYNQRNSIQDMTKFGDEDKETYDGTEYPFISKSGHLFEFKTDFDANKADLDIKNSAFSDVSTASKVSKAASFVTENDILTTEEPLSSYERCNSEILKDIMLRSMRSSLTRSKELISVITKKQLKESVSVICSHSPFSYTIISSTLFCEVWTKTLICFAYY